MLGAKERSGDRVKSGIRTREGQVDPCNVLAVRFGSGWRSFRGGKQRLALATSGSWLPRGPFPEPEFRGKQRDNLEIPSLSALPGRPRLSTSLPSSLGFLPSLSLSVFFSVGFVAPRRVTSRGETEEAEEVVDRRHKEISRTISRLPHGSRIPVNAPPMCAAVVPINRREIFIAMGCFQSRPALSALSGFIVPMRPVPCLPPHAPFSATPPDTSPNERANDRRKLTGFWKNRGYSITGALRLLPRSASTENREKIHFRLVVRPSCLETGIVNPRYARHGAARERRS